MTQTLRRHLKHWRSKIWRKGKYGVLAVLYVTVALSVDFFFCSAVGSLCLLWYMQYIICKVHEALWDLPELQALWKWSYTFCKHCYFQIWHFVWEVVQFCRSKELELEYHVLFLEVSALRAEVRMGLWLREKLQAPCRELYTLGVHCVLSLWKMPFVFLSLLLIAWKMGSSLGMRVALAWE